MKNVEHTGGRRDLDLRCYLVTSGEGPHTVEVAAEAARAGAGIIQVRSKELDDAAFLELAANVATTVHRVRPATRVVVDDRLDVAWIARRRGLPVDGVHLGNDDLPVREARELLGPDAVIGLTTGTPALVEAANEVSDVVDYLGAGPMRPTPTKDSGRPPLGVEGYRALVRATELPVVAIGDVQVDDVAALRSTGIAGVVMVRAIMDAPSPGAVVREVLARMRGAGPVVATSARLGGPEGRASRA